MKEIHPDPIGDYMVANSLNYRDVAARTGLSWTTVRSTRLGPRPITPRSAMAISNGTGIPVSELVAAYGRESLGKLVDAVRGEKI